MATLVSSHGLAVDRDHEHQHPHILRLPIELVEHLASYLHESPALLQLRLTCTEIRAKTERVMVQRHFVQRTFFPADEADMQALLEISKHATFAKSMRRIRFLLAVPNVQWPFRHLNSDEMSEEKRARLKRRRTVMRRIKSAEQAFRDNNHDSRYMCDILSNFKTAGNTPALIAGSFGDLNEQSFRPGPGRYDNATYGYAKLRRKLLLEEGEDFFPFFDTDHNQHFYHVLLRAIRETGYPVTDMVLGWCTIGLCPGVFKRWNGGMAYGSLKTLSLTLEPIYWNRNSLHMKSGLKVYRRELPNFANFLRNAGNLEELALSGPDLEYFRKYYKDPDPLLHIVVLAATAVRSQRTRGLRNLRVLNLMRMSFDFEELLDLVKAIRSTLTVLSLDQVRVACPSRPERLVRDAHGGEKLILKGSMFSESRYG